jgi:hypothetical protein
MFIRFLKEKIKIKSIDHLIKSELQIGLYNKDIK